MSEVPNWVWQFLIAAGTIAVPVITVLVLIRKHVKRLDGFEFRIEELSARPTNAVSETALQQFRADLKAHQEDDCKQLSEIKEEIGEVKETVIRTDENVKLMKERSKDHDQRNREHVENLQTAVNELNKAVAVLKETMPRKRPTR